MNNEQRKHKLKAVAFQLLVNLNPKARYGFIKEGYSYSDFFKFDNSFLQRFGFKAGNIRKLKKNFKEIAENELDRAKINKIKVIFREDNEYPDFLKEIYDPPVILYVLGDCSVLNKKCLAIVGSRKGNSYGKSVLRTLVPPVVEAGIPVVSGMAYGIDSMAHNITLQEGGITIGVNAGGLLKLYPSKNKTLAGRILENGCVVSEFPLDTVPRPFLFPIRNRIIAGLSNAILVVQAELRSGSLITARLGVEQNRDVLAVPGPITDRLSSGTNYSDQARGKTNTLFR